MMRTAKAATYVVRMTEPPEYADGAVIDLAAPVHHLADAILHGINSLAAGPCADAPTHYCAEKDRRGAGGP